MWCNGLMMYVCVAIELEVKISLLDKLSNEYITAR